MKKKLIIACDGESASGKSTAAKLVSKKYKLLLVNSGLLYRYGSKLIIKHIFIKFEVFIVGPKETIYSLLAVSRFNIINFMNTA